MPGPGSDTPQEAHASSPLNGLRAFSVYPIAYRPNPHAVSKAAYGQRQEAVLDGVGAEAAQQEIVAWPDYRQTPLLGLDSLAREADLARLWYKDESERFGLGSFKALGGAYAVSRQLKLAIRDATGGTEASTGDLLEGTYAEITRGVTVACATDGNHGRSVAWGAEAFGCRCVIFLHATVSQGREDAIARFGAEIRRVPGNYDDSVREAARLAAAEGWIVVSDTSYEGYREIPRDVMQGYTLMAAEAIEQLGGARPTHVFLQAGVGGMAAAVCAQLWRHYGPERPAVFIVEPDQAACLLESVERGEASAIEGDLDTIMAGLACGETSIIAWEILDEAAEGFLTVTDAAAGECMRLLAGNEPPIVAGESAVAGLAAVLGAVWRPEIFKALGLDADSRVLLFGTEGDTDPEVYRAIVGRAGDEVRRS